jgi:hypothetical protein
MTSPGPTGCRFAGKHLRAASGTVCRMLSCKNRPPHRADGGYGGAGCRRTWARGGGVAGWCVLALVLALVLAGCGSQQSVPLPDRATPVSVPSPASSPTPTPTLSKAAARRAAIAAYVALWPGHQRAERSGSPAKAVAILAHYTTRSYARTLAGQMRNAWRKHEMAVGHVIDHILHAGVGSSRKGQPIADIADCADGSHYGLAHRGSRRLIAGTAGPRHGYVQVYLVFAGGRWRVTGIQLLPHIKC